MQTPNSNIEFTIHKNTSYWLEENSARDKHIENLADEYMLLLMAFYKSSIEAGITRVADYRHMTMADAEIELRFRTMITASRVRSLESELREKMKQDESAFFEELQQAL